MKNFLKVYKEIQIWRNLDERGHNMLVMIDGNLMLL